ncbi:class I SAM-dependent methyltransferase [Goekera deserti]|uniref:Class I SAM-dependent methyltransferase n=1 Tax=Goekera deserti TaxID=2497753 RepID=A0A7K3WFC8_9ACTN|nr:class I SAM-dependent methyltransferase [Goekera deserti]NDI49826.1 methyltransferase domain-containing protein [Goekera deserti]NEL55188.1 class I SAM-dependent methyltransferase [Goekera deserti]
MTSRASYGVDGWPYVLGLAGSGALTSLGAVLAARAGRGRWAGALAVAAAGALVPAGLGVDYVRSGKLLLRDRLLDAVTWRGDEVVLDVGSGAGLLGLGAARRVPRGRVHCVDLWVGTDLSGNGVDRLRRNARLEGVADRVDARTVDARELDLPDRSVDVVLSSLCLHNIDDAGRRRAAGEMARVLAPGGTVAVSDLAGTDDLAAWFTADGLRVLRHERVPRTFPPQRWVLAERPR